MRFTLRRSLLLTALTLSMSSVALASDKTKAGTKEDAQKDGDQHLSGMSIVGNDEAPKSLVIVPWKSSDLGDTLDVSKTLDDGRVPVDREVFRRSLDYYEIRTSSQP